MFLSSEEEKPWKRADLWHSICLGAIAVLCVLCLIFGDPIIYRNNAKLKDALSDLNCDSVTLEEIVPFEWTTVYTFKPYISNEWIEWVTGSSHPALKESVSEGMTHVVFINRGRVVASVCATPQALAIPCPSPVGKMLITTIQKADIPTLNTAMGLRLK